MQADTFIVAVSGGPDSVYLLHEQLKERERDGRHLVIAHVNYGLRASAARDAAFVSELAETFRCDHAYKEVSEQERQQQSGNLEDWARTIRYAWFREVQKKYGARAVFLGHHANDQAETVLMRLVQGSGIRGLGGMKEKTGIFRRPLLELQKNTILESLQLRGIVYCLDETNEDRQFLRNQLRYDVLPMLEKRCPAIVEELCALAKQAQAVDAVYREKASDWISLHGNIMLEDEENRALLEKNALLDLDNMTAYAVLAHLTHLDGRNGKELKELWRFLREARNGTTKPLSNGLNVHNRRDTVAFTG